MAAGILCSKNSLRSLPMPNAASLSLLTPHLIFPDIQVCVLRRLLGILQTLDAGYCGWSGWLGGSSSGNEFPLLRLFTSGLKSGERRETGDWGVVRIIMETQSWPTTFSKLTSEMYENFCLS